MKKASDRVRLSLIAAVARNGVIGADNALPWQLSSDLRRFKSLTMGKPVIMGRKTFDSIGKPLVGRTNIVVSRTVACAPESVTVAPTLDVAIAAAESDVRQSCEKEICVIGGGSIYREAIDRADRLYITHVEATVDGDTHFPPIDPTVWQAVHARRFPAGPKDSASTTFIVYERASS